MNDDYDFSEDFNKSGGMPPSSDEGGGRRPLLRDLPKADNSLRSMLSVPVAGGSVAPAKIGNTYGAKWTKNFSKGGKVSSASKRADGIAERGKTKGRYL